MNIHQELRRLAAEGDERGIKRAYAKALKHTRPDEDPVGFQQLHALYQHALAQGRQQQEADQDHDAAEVAKPDAIENVVATKAAIVPAPVMTAPPDRRVATVLLAQVVDVALPPQPEPDDALAAMLRESVGAVPGDFPGWLRVHGREWSLDTRDAVALRLLQALRGDEVVVCESNVLAMYNLLGWNDIASGVDARELQWLAERSHRAWLQLPTQHPGLAVMISGLGPSRLSAGQVAARLAALQTPRSHLRNLLSALRPDRARTVVALMEALGCRPGVPLPKGIDSRQASFWAGQAQPWHRLAMHVWLFRSAVLGLVLVALSVLVMWFDGHDRLLSDSPLQSALWAAAAVLLPPALVLGHFIRRALYDSQLAAETMPSPRPGLRAWGVPLLVGALLLVAATYRLFIDWAPLYMFALWLLTWQVLRVAQFRYYLRRKARPPGGTGALFLMVLGTMLFVPAVVAAMSYWAMDLRRARAMRWWNE